MWTQHHIRHRGAVYGPSSRQVVAALGAGQLDAPKRSIACVSDLLSKPMPRSSTRHVQRTKDKNPQIAKSCTAKILLLPSVYERRGVQNGLTLDAHAFTKFVFYDSTQSKRVCRSPLSLCNQRQHSLKNEWHDDRNCESLLSYRRKKYEEKTTQN